jgi:hypothetical protein
MGFFKVGFGGYRIDERVQEHYDSLTKALLNGFSMIDTSSNYSDGRSEILIGNVLSDLLSSEKIKRENITLVTKGGYIQGQNYKFASKKKEQGNPFSKVVELSDGLWHCISPDFLEDQINRQLFRLNQSDEGGYIDVYLLHNPEYYLTWASDNHLDKDISQDEYYIRIKKAFEFLEEKVKSGKIHYYGISSNTFISRSNKYNFTSLERILEIVDKCGYGEHFKFIELPFNLIESGALFEKNQMNDTKTVLELAKEKGINVLINRPLNAITSKGLVRLADFELSEITEGDISKKLQYVLLLEDDLLKEKLANINIPGDDFKILESLLTFGKVIDENWKSFGSIENFNDFIEHYFSPRIDYLVEYFDEHISDDYSLESFNNYMQEIFNIINAVSGYYKNFANKRNHFFHSIINDICGSKYHNLTLSQKSVLLINSIDGVSCTLIGARKEKYVDDIISTLSYDKIENAGDIFLKIREEMSNSDISGTNV